MLDSGELSRLSILSESDQLQCSLGFGIFPAGPADQLIFRCFKYHGANAIEKRNYCPHNWQFSVSSMKYVSTRGLEKNVSFQDVLFAGYSRDGGLYFPEAIPRLSQQQLIQFSTLSYQDLIVELLTLYIDHAEISRDELKEAANRAFVRFDTDEVMHVTRLNGGLRVSELFHGPTLAFKDLGLNMVAQLIQIYQSRCSTRCLMLVGTSGDTGSAAIQSVLGLDSVDIVVLLPDGRCTETQQLQMTTCIADNVHIFAVDGNSDELDEPIKKCFEDSSFVEKHKIISTNSINWARILTQMTHFFYSYFKTCESVGDVVEMIVPTGAAGNITAGSVAARMGLPIRLIACVNRNDIIHRALTRGDFSRTDQVDITLAPAMDIQVPYNIERLLYIFSEADTDVVSAAMSEFTAERRTSINNDLLCRMKMIITGTHVAEDEDIISAIERCWRENAYAICPHTATAVAYHYRIPSERNVIRICVATAAADKFPEALARSGASTFTPCDRIRQLKHLPQKFDTLKRADNWELMLRNKIEAITTSHLL